MKKKNIADLANHLKQKEAEKYQNEKKKSLIQWQIDNKCVIQPILQPSIDNLRASFIFVEATNEQLNAFKKILNEYVEN